MAIRKMIRVQDLLDIVQRNISSAEEAIKYKSFGTSGTYLTIADNTLNALYTILTRKELEYHYLVGYSDKITELQLLKKEKMDEMRRNYTFIKE